MKALFPRVMAGLLLMAGAASAEPAIAAVKKAVCVVCYVTKGETEQEEVKAARTHDAKEYAFCSEKCAKAFDADPAAYAPPAFPRPAPTFSLMDLSGEPLSNERVKGKVVLLDFWATWCAPCRKSMPDLQRLHRKYADRGFAVVGVSIDEGGAAKVKKYVASKKFTYPIAVDSNDSPAWEAFRVKAVPAAYLLDREGRIVAQWTGTVASVADLEAKLEGLLRAD
jgi:peroxiredoxin/YHS domain-containing protein